MNPNQPQNQNPQPGPPQQPTPPPTPEVEPRYSTGTPAYDPNYLDSISPGPPQQKFFSGSFGKIFFAMLGLFALAVSLIVAFSGQDNTADLQQMSVRLDNIEKTADSIHEDIDSSNLRETNTQFRLWAADSKRRSEELLQLGGITRTDFNKEMVRAEEARAEEMNDKFEDARLSARLHRVYSTTMALEAEVLINMFTQLQKNPSSKIREYAANSIENLTPIKKSFSEFVDDGN